MSKPSAERLLESGLFADSWLMAPFHLGLVIASIVVMPAMDWLNSRTSPHHQLDIP